MKFIFALFLFALIGLAQIHSSTGIKCYSCIYHEDSPNSSETCKDAPTMDELDTNYHLKGIRHCNRALSSKSKSNSGKSETEYCFTLTGEILGKDYIERGYAYGEGDEIGDHNCWDKTPPGFEVPPNFEVDSLCVCRGRDYCNNGVGIGSGSVVTMVISSFLVLAIGSV